MPSLKGTDMPVIVSNIVSLDGFYEGAEGHPLVLNMDHAFDAYNCELMRAADTVLLGRRSFEMFSGHWPGVADAPDDAGDPTLGEVNREMSRRYNAISKVVVSDSYVVPADNPWHGTTVVLTGAAVGDRLRAQQVQGAGETLVFGSRDLWHSLLAQGLVDELHLMIGPNAVGAGTPLFDGPCALALKGVREFDGSDNVLVRYAVRS